MSSYERMRPEDRKRAVDAGLIQDVSKLSDDVPSKDRRYNLEWRYCGVTEMICENKTWIFCKTMKDRKRGQRQYVDEKFLEIIRVS